MKEAGKMLGLILSEIEQKIKPGVTGLELDQYAENRMLEMGVVPAFKGYNGFSNTLCVNINEEVVHGIPNNKPFQDGDLITVDCGLIHKSFYSDSAITVGAGKISPQAEKMIKVAYKALENGIAAAGPGVRINQISKAIEETIVKAGYNVVKELSGHGIGTQLHEDPYVLNYQDGELWPALQPGMTLAIEPIFTAGSAKTKTLSDGWTIVTKDKSLAIQVEHTIAITEKGAEILTKRPK